MNHRIAKVGNQKPWTLEELKNGLELFYKEHGKYPTSPEIDAFAYLPSARSIERRFGGVVALRKKLNLSGQDDLRAGAHSSERAKTINKRAHLIEQNVYEFLIKRFSKELVHREFFFTDDKRLRADFFVYNNKRNFCVDVFYPKDRRNLAGCINSKLKKYKTDEMKQYPIIFLQMNEKIDQDIIDDLIKNKKYKMPSGQSVMTWKTFQKFCK